MNDSGPMIPAIRDLLALRPVMGLEFGPPLEAMRNRLAAIDDAAFGSVIDRDAAAACRAGLWLAFDFFEESHAISQELDTLEGSYWHAILHRREPDPANAKYWFRRVGDHPVLAELEQEAISLGFAVSGGNGFAGDFISACTRAGNLAERVQFLRRIQHREWQLLYEHCIRPPTS